LLIDKPLTADLLAKIAWSSSQECSPTDDLRGSERYKRAVVGTLVKRAAARAYERAVMA
jgi:carbon-monoxide dehydrogenase medium subunit